MMRHSFTTSQQISNHSFHLLSGFDGMPALKCGFMNGLKAWPMLIGNINGIDLSVAERPDGYDPNGESGRYRFRATVPTQA
jgi:hypothetical protein